MITHSLKEPLAVGETVHGIIDWTHRFNNMQQHSGEHIFSGIVHSRFGYDNVGFHLSDNIVTMDFNGVLTTDEVREVETAVNEVIVKNLPVEITYPSKEELKTLDYRSKIEIEGQVRIVTIPGVDVCACCAPHVKKTGEIGMLNVQSLSNYKGGVRISILSGFRALEEERKKSQVISSISGTLSANQELLPELVEKLKSYGLNMTNLNVKNQDYDSYFNGKTIVLTGTLSFIGRTEASKILENECGAKMTNSVSKKTSLVIVGENPGSKYQKAIDLKIPVMEENEFHQKLIDEKKLLV